MSLKKNSTSNLCKVQVEFFKELSIQETICEITKIPNPQVLLWYIGPNGLKNESVDFYRDFLICPIFNKNEKTTFWLVDLTAWGAFNNPKCSVNAYSKHCHVIEELDDRLKCIKSSDILRKIRDVKEKNIISYLKKTIKKDFLHKMSANFPNGEILVKDVFSGDCSIFSDWHNHYISKFYSVVQYLEGCFLIDEILSGIFEKNEQSHVDIVFALPNDEYRYYKDDFCSFQKDVEYLISKRRYSQSKVISINIYFFPFQYGAQETYRPYNAPGKTLAKREISFAKVAGEGNKEYLTHNIGYAYATNQ